LKDGFKKGVIDTLVGVCGRGNGIEDILEDVQDIYL
jgi:hypothetical protein